MRRSAKGGVRRERNISSLSVPKRKPKIVAGDIRSKMFSGNQWSSLKLDDLAAATITGVAVAVSKCVQAGRAIILQITSVISFWYHLFKVCN